MKKAAPEKKLSTQLPEVITILSHSPTQKDYMWYNNNRLIRLTGLTTQALPNLTTNPLSPLLVWIAV